MANKYMGFMFNWKTNGSCVFTV